MWSSNNTNSTNSSSVPQLSNCDQFFYLIIRTLKQITPASLTASLASLTTTSLSTPFIVILNTFIVVAFYKKPAIRTQANIILGAIAVTDLANGAVCCPLFLAREIVYQMKLEPNCYLEGVVNLSIFTGLISALQISLLNCERFLGLKFPIWHRNNITKKRLLTAVVLSWFVSAILISLKVFRIEGEILLLLMSIGSSISTISFLP